MVKSSFARAKERYLLCRLEAYKSAQETLAPILDCGFCVKDWSLRTAAAIALQWGIDRHSDGGWNWPEIIRRYKAEPDALPFAIWFEPTERLAAIGLGVATRRAIELRFLEGDPRTDCPIRGKRALIALEVAFAYARACGKQEIRVRPVNASLERLYIKTYGFERIEPSGQAPYLRRNVT